MNPSDFRRNSSALTILSLSLGVIFSTAFGQPSYQNPVVAGDYPDPSIIRVGKEYWATSTSSEWGPQFPLLHSTDLVNWEIAGSVLAHRPAWAVGNFWAPEISEYKDRYFVYYVGRKKDGPLAVAVAAADSPSGPYTDYGPLVAQDAGSIDPVPVTDEKGVRYLIWKEDGNSRKLPTIIWAQRLSEDGLKLTGDRKELLRNDAPWEGAVVEGPFVLRHGEWFYMFYSGSGCCGRGCNYALGVARAKSLTGPWEKNPANPILAGNDYWKCPGHGSIVADPRNHYWFLYHAYSARNFVFTGREAMLDEVKFDSQGWPTINHGKGPGVLEPSPFGLPQARNPLFQDHFSGKLIAGWQWPQNAEPTVEFPADFPNGLALRPGQTAKGDLLDAILARSTTSGDYTATTIILVSELKSGCKAGITAIGDTANAAGLVVGSGKLTLWRRDKGQHKNIAEVNAPEGPKIYFQLKTSHGHNFEFSFSPDGKSWTSVGNPQSGEHFPPWDRSIRVGLTAGGATVTSGRFGEFQLLNKQ